jgi:hypothetical protein
MVSHRYHTVIRPTSASAAAGGASVAPRSPLRARERLIKSRLMDAVFSNAPMQPTCVEVQVMRISFDASCRYCRRHATMNIRPVKLTLLRRETDVG